MHIFMYMSDRLDRTYRRALSLVNVSDLARWGRRAFRTLQSYRSGERRVTEGAAHELIAYLRQHSGQYSAAAKELEEALREEDTDE